MEETRQRPNYYILLDLSYNPPVKDSTIIEAAIKKKNSEWNRLANNPRRGKEVAEYRSMLPDIRRVMLQDLDARDKEAENAKKLVQQEQSANNMQKHNQLANTLGIILASGSISETDIERIVKKLGVTYDEVVAHLPAGTRIEKAVSPLDYNETSAKPVLPKEKQNKISDLLKELAIKPSKGNIPTLYDFLDMPEDAPSDQILKVRHTMAMDLQRQPISTEVSYRKDVCSYIKTIFQQEEERQKYDNSLGYLRFANVEKTIDIVGERGVIDLTQFNTLLSKAIEQGLTHDDAESLIKFYCHTKGYVLYLDANAGFAPVDHKALNQCGHCGKYNEEQAKCCGGCGAPLKQECLSCKKVSPSIAKNCTNCGLSFEQMLKYQELVKKGISAITLKDLHAAEGNLLKAQIIVKTDEVAQQLQRVHTLKQRVTQLTNDVANLINKKAYFKAKEKIEEVYAITNAPSSVLQQYELQVKLQIDELADKLPDMMKLSKAERTIEVLDVLKVCIDCPWALTMLETLPPTAPSLFVAEVKGQDIELRWKSLEPEGDLLYKIYRTEVTKPMKVLDGQLMVETTAFQFTDTQTEPNKNYWYSIYTYRGDHRIHLPSVRGPIARFSEATNVKLERQGEAVAVTWDAALNATSIVVRKEGSKSNSEKDGVVLYEGMHTSFVDDTVEKGKNYFYTVYSQLVLHGKELVTNGVTASISLVSISTIEDFTFKFEDTKCYISYDIEGDLEGQVQFYRSKKPFPFTLGSMLPMSSIQSQYEELAYRQEGACKVSIDALQEGYYVLPTVSDGRRSITGKAKYVQKIDTISDVEVSHKGDRVYLSWDWPPHVTAVVLSYAESEEELTYARSYFITKDEYLTQKGVLVNIVDPQKLFITIAAVLQVEETKEQLTSEKTIQFITLGQKIRIPYAIEKYGWLRKSGREMVISCAEELKVLPALVVVVKAGELPLHASDGQIVYELPATRHSDERIDIDGIKFHHESIKLDLTKQKGKNVFARLFFKNVRDAASYELIPMGSTEL